MLAELFSTLSTYGYFGIFLISLIGSATIILPIPSAIVIFSAGAFLNPFIVGLLGGIGAAIGEFTGYGIGLGGRRVIKKKWKRGIDKVEKLFQKYGGFIILIIFAATPLPDDIVGLFCGISKYEIKKFFIAVLIGKIILHLILAYAGFYGISWILEITSTS